MCMEDNMIENYLNPPDIDYPDDDRTEDEIETADRRYNLRREDENEAKRKGTW